VPFGIHGLTNDQFGEVSQRPVYEAVAFERELAHRANLMSIARPCQPSLCNNAHAPKVGFFG